MANITMKETPTELLSVNDSWPIDLDLALL